MAEVCRKLEITEQTFYKWERRVGDMGIAELTRLRQLEDENKKLKALVVQPHGPTKTTSHAQRPSCWPVLSLTFAR